jgi:hypothetical protein
LPPFREQSPVDGFVENGEICEIVYVRSGLVQSMSYIWLPTFACAVLLFGLQA